MTQLRWETFFRRSGPLSRIIAVEDFSAPELDVYARLTENQLVNRAEPDKGLFIAESPVVIERALDAGCVPVSFLMEEKHVAGKGRPLIERCGDVPVYAAPLELLVQLRSRGFKTAAMALSADSVSLRDAALNSEEKLAVVLGTEGDGLAASTIAHCDYTVRIPMSHGVDSLNVAAASAVAFYQLGKTEEV